MNRSLRERKRWNLVERELPRVKQDISFMQYMRAHGNTPGPTQRPLLTGVICGLIAFVPSAFLLYITGALVSLAQALKLNLLFVLLLDAALAVIGGVLYAEIFKRAANDRRGGWLFGICYGFSLWMLGPTTIWQMIASQPIAIGYAAMGLFGSNLLYGVALGCLFPRVHYLLQSKLSSDDTSSLHGAKKK